MVNPVYPLLDFFQRRRRALATRLIEAEQKVVHAPNALARAESLEQALTLLLGEAEAAFSLNCAKLVTPDVHFIYAARVAGLRWAVQEIKDLKENLNLGNSPKE